MQADCRLPVTAAWCDVKVACICIPPTGPETIETIQSPQWEQEYNCPSTGVKRQCTVFTCIRTSGRVRCDAAAAGWNNGITGTDIARMIRIGPAGWKYKDWEGIVYPKPAPRGFDPLAYIADYFTTVEINTSYYGSPKPESTRKWVQSVRHNRDFRFTAKLFHSFTHERKPAPSDEDEFKAGIGPIVEAGRLGAILIQFPWSFKNEPENREYLWRLQSRFREYPLVVEVRHVSWATEEVLDAFADLGIGLCNIDQPLFHRSVKPSALATARVGYVRLHGRNYRNWFSPHANVRERYDYLYSPQELEPWVDRVKSVAEDAEETYAVTNNHNFGKSAVNALQMEAFIGGSPVRIPASLLVRYPELQEISDEAGSGRLAFG
jgi:uncharacterized protein YecE (DUF72 family)